MRISRKSARKLINRCRRWMSSARWFTSRTRSLLRMPSTWWWRRYDIPFPPPSPKHCAYMLWLGHLRCRCRQRRGASCRRSLGQRSQGDGTRWRAILETLRHCQELLGQVARRILGQRKTHFPPNLHTERHSEDDHQQVSLLSLQAWWWEDITLHHLSFSYTDWQSTGFIVSSLSITRTCRSESCPWEMYSWRS